MKIVMIGITCFENKSRFGLMKIFFVHYSVRITLDSDGQHYAEDIPLFVEAVEKNQGALIIGNRNLMQDNMPKKNTFANKFSNFWFALQTGIKLLDTQTGYRY